MTGAPGGRATLLENCTVLTMDAEARVLREASILVIDGEIRDVGEISVAPPEAERLSMGGELVLPGLVQSHLHLGQTFFRGLGEGRRLLPWLRERIWPLEAAHTDDSAYWSALLGGVECLLGGTTAVQEIGLGPGASGLLAGLVETGLRGTAGMCLMDSGEGLPAGLASGTDGALSATIELGERLERESDGRLRYSLTPRFILSASDELWRGVCDLAAERDWGVHTHALEHLEETEVVRSLKGGRDEIEYFEDVGLLERPFCVAHGVHLEEKHRPSLATKPFSVAHCPSANLRLGSGIADVVGLRAAGIPVGVGADGAACNNDLDGFEEVRLAAMLQQVSRGPEAFGGLDALRLATSEGAEAIGLGDSVGSLEPGKRADLIVLDTSGPEWSAADSVDPHDLVVFVASRGSVRHVMIDGDWKVWGGALTRLDLDRIQSRADLSRRDLLARAELPL